jgi:tol-pal system protein YbgF
MPTPTLRSIAALSALLLLLGGCTLGRSRPSAVAPREQPSASALNADVETLRRENSQLRDEQAALQERLESLQRTLAQQQEEQRRYRESMTKNFDLLEQSVALTLSKTITADLGARSAPPAQAARSEPVAMRPPTEPGASMPSARSQAGAPRAAQPPAPQAAPATLRTAASAALAGPMATSAAMGPAAPAAGRTVDDPDLLPPRAPRALSAHQEAKPLYEKGFALFARKDYDQAAIVFENFLKRFPDDIYSDNAQFWIAESYLNQGRPREAETAYRAVLRDYEHRSTLEGYKTPDAIYRLGQLHQQRNDARMARLYFDALVERFPETSAGRKAQRELATVGINTAAR